MKIWKICKLITFELTKNWKILVYEIVFSLFHYFFQFFFLSDCIFEFPLNSVLKLKMSIFVWKYTILKSQTVIGLMMVKDRDEQNFLILIRSRVNVELLFDLFNFFLIFQLHKTQFVNNQFHSIYYLEKFSSIFGHNFKFLKFDSWVGIIFVVWRLRFIIPSSVICLQVSHQIFKKFYFSLVLS